MASPDLTGVRTMYAKYRRTLAEQVQPLKIHHAWPPPNHRSN